MLNKKNKKIFLILIYIYFIINFFINIEYNKNNFKGNIFKINIISLNNNKKLIRNNIIKKSKKYIYYGYTHCPDICPKIIEKLNYIIKYKKNFYKKKIIFFSIDNKRDNSELSQKYIIKLKLNNLYSITNNNYNEEKTSLNIKNVYENKILKKNKYKINHGKILYKINKYFNIKNIII